MEKRNYLFVAMLAAMPFVNPISVSADPEPVPLKGKTLETNNLGDDPLPKSPVIKPQIGIEDYTLYIYTEGVVMPL